MKQVKTKIRLGVNIDHIATLRQARGGNTPDPLTAALIAVAAGADGITVHLREDRRHIQTDDVQRLKQQISVPLNLEMAATESIVQIAEKICPTYCCLVPEKRQEVTTEGGLDANTQRSHLTSVCARLKACGIKVSFFIDADYKQIEAAKTCGADTIELHTGQYAHASNLKERDHLLKTLHDCALFAHKAGLIVNAGHGLTLENVLLISKLPHLNELNIGHSIISRSLFVGLFEAVSEMKLKLS